MSEAHRTAIANLLFPLRRTHPRVPFFKLAAHRIPTLWSLYRGLLKQAPDDNVRFKIQTQFRNQRHLTSPTKTKEELMVWHRMLNWLQKARQGSMEHRVVVDRYSKLVAAHIAKSRVIVAIYDDMLWRERLRQRPIVTGGYLKPTLFNRPLPRLKPQPVAISVMIRKRRRAREMRIDKSRMLIDWLAQLKCEKDFEERLLHAAASYGQSFERTYENLQAWEGPIKKSLTRMHRSFQLDYARSRTRHSPQLVALVKEARRRKILNKTREKDLARRGFYTTRVLRRMRGGPPAHVLAKMTEEEKVRDRAIRGFSEVGFVARMKLQKGMKLKYAPEWDVEEGAPNERASLNAAYEAIRRINYARRLRSSLVEE